MSIHCFRHAINFLFKFKYKFDLAVNPYCFAEYWLLIVHLEMSSQLCK